MRDCVEPARLLLAAFAVLFLSVRRLTARIGGEVGRMRVSFAERFGGAVTRLPLGRGRYKFWRRPLQDS